MYDSGNIYGFLMTSLSELNSGVVFLFVCLFCLRKVTNWRHFIGDLKFGISNSAFQKLFLSF